MVFVRCRTAVLLFAATFLLAPVYGQSNTDAEITFAQKREEQARQQLRRLLSEYDLDPWIFTRTVKIEAGAVPRSHPIATLNTSTGGSTSGYWKTPKRSGPSCRDTI